MKNRFIQIILFIVILAVLVIGGGLYWHHQKFYPSTDDAYTQAHVINIAPRITGVISKIYVKDHQYVTKGQPLFSMDPKPFTISLDKAIANLDETIQQVNAARSAVITARSMVTERKAELINTEKNAHRTMHLVKKKLYAQAQGDKAQSDLKVAKAALAAAKSQLQEAQQKLGHLGGANASIRAAKANIAEANLNLQYTDVVAPSSGYISNFNLRDGDPVNAYQDIFAIVENDEFWASANFKETDLERIHPGQTATVRIDMYPHVLFKGVVSSISAGSGTSFALLPPENATGNWVKVTQRFPVRVDITTRYKKYPLRIGSSCEVTIDTRNLKSTAK
jgi:membrane fusion protein (multidrug efflux system)